MNETPVFFLRSASAPRRACEGAGGGEQDTLTLDIRLRQNADRLSSSCHGLLYFPAPVSKQNVTPITDLAKLRNLGILDYGSGGAKFLR